MYRFEMIQIVLCGRMALVLNPHDVLLLFQAQMVQLLAEVLHDASKDDKTLNDETSSQALRMEYIFKLKISVLLPCEVNRYYNYCLVKIKIFSKGIAQI